MSENKKIYEAPTMKVYQFDDRDQVLTASSNTGGNTGGGTTDNPGETPSQSADYAARALNNLMGGTNTTIE